MVISNGGRIPPVDIEAAIARDTLFEQVMLLGEGKPYLSRACSNHEQWETPPSAASIRIRK